MQKISVYLTALAFPKGCLQGTSCQVSLCPRTRKEWSGTLFSSRNGNVTNGRRPYAVSKCRNLYRTLAFGLIPATKDGHLRYTSICHGHACHFRVDQLPLKLLFSVIACPWLILQFTLPSTLHHLQAAVGRSIFCKVAHC